jgi:hypothetical protein
LSYTEVEIDIIDGSITGISRSAYTDIYIPFPSEALFNATTLKAKISFVHNNVSHQKNIEIHTSWIINIFQFQAGVRVLLNDEGNQYFWSELGVVGAENISWNGDFYEKSKEQQIDNGDIEDGNLTLHNKPFLLNKQIDVPSAKGDLVILDYPFSQLEKLSNEATDFIIKGKILNGDGSEITERHLSIGCHYEHPTDPKKSIVTINGLSDKITANSIWEGTMYYSLEITPENDEIVLNEDKKFAHSGKKSMIVEEEKHYEQYKLELCKDKKYVLGAWVRVEDDFIGKTPNLGMGIGIKVGFGDEYTTNEIMFEPKGPVIEGWQRIEGYFTPPTYGNAHFTFMAGSEGKAYFDDIRVFPFNGGMQSYVYDTKNYRLQTTLDANNYASYYYYDLEGNLYLVKKETVEGIKTIQESISHQIEAK